MYPRVLPQNVKRMRQQLGMTQKELGKIIGVHRRTFQKWELGTQKVSQLNGLKLYWWHRKLMRSLHNSEYCEIHAPHSPNSSKQGDVPNTPKKLGK